MRAWSIKGRQSAGWGAIKLAGKRWAEEDGDQRAAAIAYYLLLSLLPLVLLFITVGSLFVDRDLATEAVVKLIDGYIPLTVGQKSSTVETIRGVLETRGKISLAAMALLALGALKFLRALVRTTNRVWRAETYTWWRVPLKSLGLLGITASAVVIGILLPFVAQISRPWLTATFGAPDWAFVVIFNLIPWFVLFYGLVMIYKLAPRQPTRFSDVWMGALGATILVRMSELLFVVYMDNSGRFNALYGALGGVVAFLLWIYFSSCICVFGVCYCAARTEWVGTTHDRPQ